MSLRTYQLSNAIPSLIVAERGVLGDVGRTSQEREWGLRILRVVEPDGGFSEPWKEQWVDDEYHVARRALASLPTGRNVNNNHATAITVAAETFDASLYNPDGSYAQVVPFPSQDTNSK
ncbi:MAG: hypothetical protein JWP13_495 [Candidatus Saccharibacteria bacterium]|nr:hypothetical protein [Candidatus Saccharibacteria bacterium]